MFSQSIKSPVMWSRATWSSIVVLSALSLFMAALFGAAEAAHAAHHAIGLTGVGTVMFAVLAGAQVRMLLAER